MTFRVTSFCTEKQTTVFLLRVLIGKRVGDTQHGVRYDSNRVLGPTGHRLGEGVEFAYGRPQSKWWDKNDPCSFPLNVKHVTVRQSYDLTSRTKSNNNEPISLSLYSVMQVNGHSMSVVNADLSILIVLYNTIQYSCVRPVSTSRG